MRAEKLARRVGLSGKELTVLRGKLAQGVDWERRKKGTWYTAAGVAKVKALVGGLVQAAAPPETPVGDVADLVVTRLCPNALWVEARVVGRAELGMQLVRLVGGNNRVLRSAVRNPQTASVLRGCVREVNAGLTRWVWRAR